MRNPYLRGTAGWRAWTVSDALGIPMFLAADGRIVQRDEPDAIRIMARETMTPARVHGLGENQPANMATPTGDGTKI